MALHATGLQTFTMQLNFTLRNSLASLVAAIALANKMARGLWAMITKHEDYRNPAATMA